MTLRQAIELFKDHQKNSARDKTRESYGHLFRNLEALFGDATLSGVSSQALYQFLLLLAEGLARSTARLRYAQLKAFFNFVIERSRASMANPCNDSLLSKTFRALRMKQREIIGREVVDEIIYRCQKTRNRLILGTPGTLRSKDRGSAEFADIGRKRAKTDVTAAKVGPRGRECLHAGNAGREAEDIR